MIKHPELSSQDFTTKKNDDTMKVSDKNSFTNDTNKLNNSFKMPKSYPYKEQKPKDSITVNKEYKLGDMFKTPKLPKVTIPNEKLERKRLEKLTGAYDLNSVSSDIIEENKRLKKKTDPNYYRDDKNLSLKEVNQRLDEVFGPKTDFSIHNFENNYDKMNLEEQEMLTHKMQLHFNNEGYGDSRGFRLETDGKFGPKTQGAYKRYISDNKADYDEAIADKKAYKEYKSADAGTMALKEVDSAPQNTNLAPKSAENTSTNINVNSVAETKVSTSEPKTYEVAKTNYNQPTSTSKKVTETVITDQNQSHLPRVASPVSSRSFDRGIIDVSSANLNSKEEKETQTLNEWLTGNEAYKDKSERTSLSQWIKTPEIDKEKKENFLKELSDDIKENIRIVNYFTKNLLPKEHKYSNEAQKIVWRLGAENFLRKKKNYQTAAWMLEHSLEENPSDIVRYNDSNIAYKINNSKEYLDKIDELIRNSKDGIIDKPGESISFSDNDLYLSINKAEFHIKGFVDNSGVWYFHTVMEDTYDFTEIIFGYGPTAIKFLGTVANDVAFASQVAGAIKPYKVTVDFYTRRDPNGK